MLDLGGNIFYIFKLAMVDQKSMQYLGGVFTGMTEEDFAAMIRASGRSDDLDHLGTGDVTRSVNRRCDRPGQDGRPLLEAALRRLPARPGLDGRAHAGRSDWNSRAVPGSG
jgi:hypothetical protein